MLHGYSLVATLFNPQNGKFMIVAITGGTGFIGKKLVESLVRRGDTIRLLTRHGSITTENPSSVVIYECDLVTVETNKLSTLLDGVDVLYHCAGQLTDPHSMRVLHVDATRNLAEAASQKVAHWVQLSSVGVYGPVSEGVISEEAGLNPVGQYEIIKTESDQIVADTANRGGFSYSILRPSNVFGAGMTNKSLLNMITMIDRRLFSYIGRPGASANYIHVNNVVEGLVRCGTMHPAKGRIYNLSDHCTIEHFVEVLAAALGCASPWTCKLFVLPHIPHSMGARL